MIVLRVLYDHASNTHKCFLSPFHSPANEERRQRSPTKLTASKETLQEKHETFSMQRSETYQG